MNYQKVYINQVSSTSTMDYLTQMWKNQLLCDAVIKTGNKVTKAHRVVLIAACPMLQSMDNASLGSHLEVRMAADIKQDSINAFLQYIYEGYVMLTEENCQDIEKMAKLLQVESLLNCCSDFYKNLSEKTGKQHGGLLLNCKHGFNLQHLKFSNLQKTVSDTAMKRGAISKEVMSDNKRQRFCTESEKERGPTHNWTSVSSMNSSEQSNAVHLVEENLEVIHTDPATRDEEGWPEWSSGPGVSQSQAISVSSQQNVQSDTQVVRISDDDSGSISTDGSVEQLHHMKIISQNSIPLYPSNNSIPSELHKVSTASPHVSAPNRDSTTCQLSHIPVTIGHQQFSQPQSLSSSPHIPFAAGSERQQIYVEPLSDLPKSERVEEFAGRNFVSERTTLSDDNLTKQSKGDSVEDESQKVTDLLCGEKSQQSNESLKTVDLTRVKMEEDETGGLELSVDPCQDVEENIDDYDDGVDDDISYEQEDSMVRTDESPHSIHSKEGHHQSQGQEPLFSRYYQNLPFETKKEIVSFFHVVVDKLQQCTHEVNSCEQNSVNSSSYNQTKEERKLPLLQFDDDNGIYDDVLVNPTSLRMAEMKSKVAKTPAVFLLNKVLGLVFTETELIEAKGAKGLNKHKMDAIRGVLDTNIIGARNQASNFITPGDFTAKRHIQCRDCSNMFANFDELYKHKRDQECQGYYLVCQYCYKSFKSQGGYNLHMEAKHNRFIEVNACGLCTERFDTKKDLIDHLVRVENHGYHKICIKCWRGFKTEQGYGTHMKLKHGH